MTPKLPISAKIVVTGEAVKPLVDAVVDLFSPITEPLGWLGDVFRDHRLRSALKCLARAKELAENQGEKLKAPPAKFLSQYIESCSLEDNRDKQLIEWWAQLLVDAGAGFQGKHIFYTNILRQITSTELEILECIVRNGKGTYPLELVCDAEFAHDFSFDTADIKLADRLTESAVKKAGGSIRSALERPGALVLDLFVDDENSKQRQEFHPDYQDGELSSWQMLQSLQLVRLGYHRFSAGSVEYRVRTALITELGAQFYFACHEEGFKRRLSTKSRFKRKRSKVEKSR
jgi:hypothetical protein